MTGNYTLTVNAFTCATVDVPHQMTGNYTRLRKGKENGSMCFKCKR